MRPTEIRAAYRRNEMSFYRALRALMEIGFGDFAAEEYLYAEAA